MARDKLRIHRHNRIKLTLSDKIYQIIICAVVGLVTITCIFPLLYVIGMSVTSEGELMQRNYFVIIPWHPTFLAYTQILGMPNFFNSIFISAARAILGCIAALILTVPGGYILAKHDMPGRKYVMMFFIVTMLIGGGLIPDYLLRKDLGLLDSFWVYIIPAMGGTFSMLIIKIFVENIPSDIIESADLDGATEIQKLLHIALPLLIPVLYVLALLSVANHWNDWFTAHVYVNSPELYPVQLVLRNIMYAANITLATYPPRAEGVHVPENAKMVAVVVGIIPVIIFYPFLHKHLIHGVYTGAVKE